MAHVAVGTPLKAFEEALAGLTDIELHAVKVASSESPRPAPRLLAWIEGACDWEINRRHGLHYMLQPPEAARDSSEDAVTIKAVYAMHASFALSGFALEALPFFDVLLKLLAGGYQKN